MDLDVLWLLEDKCHCPLCLSKARGLGVGPFCGTSVFLQPCRGDLFSLHGIFFLFNINLTTDMYGHALASCWLLSAGVSAAELMILVLMISFA